MQKRVKSVLLMAGMELTKMKPSHKVSPVLIWDRYNQGSMSKRRMRMGERHWFQVLWLESSLCKKRFGRLEFSELFKPAITYAEEGVIVSPVLASFFSMRASAFKRTPEGREFLQQSGRDIPEVGDRFKQLKLAATLRAVAVHGSQEMYTGEWADKFVSLVRREGGKVTSSDLKCYEPEWSKAFVVEAFGHSIFTTPLPNTGAYSVALGLNLADELDFDARKPVWVDPNVWSTFSRITAITQHRSSSQ